MANVTKTTSKGKRIPKDEWIKNMQATREQLKAYSEQVKPLVEAGRFSTINEAIISTIYQDGKNREFKSFHQWRQEGYFVKLGQKGFPVWSRPVASIKEEKNKEQGKEEPIFEEDTKMFRVAYLFSNEQVKQESKSERRAAA